MTMEYTDDQIKNKILQILHKLPDKMLLRKNILEPLKIDIEPVHARILYIQLMREGLIKEYEMKPDDEDFVLEITKEGYEVIEYFEDYIAYKKEQKKYKNVQRELDYLKAKNIRLTNLNLIVGIISFILGILLSSPIKRILMQWLTSDG